jgi:hypothetical protein
MKKSYIALLVTTLAFMGVTWSAHSQTIVSGNVTTDTTWSGEVVMDGAVFVKNDATLTILPGTIVRGQPRTAAVSPGSTVGTPGVLIVTTSGLIDARGSATNPIIFTTAAIDNNGNGEPDVSGSGFLLPYTPGDTFYDATPTTAPLSPLDQAGNGNISLWGGIVLLGEAPTNLGADSGTFGETTVEGLTVPGFPAADATYGGNLVHDFTGRMSYVSVRHAGDEIGESNELNGITLGGVGDATQFDHIEIYCNFDDGIEWFGGNVDGSHLVVTFAGDDALDLDQGYSGINQFQAVTMPFFNLDDGENFGSKSGDKGGEWDGDDCSGNCSFRYDANIPSIDPGSVAFVPSGPAMYNITLLGAGAGNSNPAVVSAKSGNGTIQGKKGFRGAMHNSIIASTGDQEGADFTGVPTEVAAGEVQVFASTFTEAATTAETLTVLNADPRNCNGSPSFAGLVNGDTGFDPKGFVNGAGVGVLDASLKASPINPRVVNNNCTADGDSTGPDNAATYRGAFDSSVVKLWTSGWTALSMGGILAD